MNPGIVRTVAELQAAGFRTVDSGDGETHEFECDQPGPYVHMECAPDALIGETHRLRDWLRARGIEAQPMDETNSVPCIEASYNPVHGEGLISLWNVRL